MLVSFTNARVLATGHLAFLCVSPRVPGAKHVHGAVAQRPGHVRRQLMGGLGLPQPHNTHTYVRRRQAGAMPASKRVKGIRTAIPARKRVKGMHTACKTRHQMKCWFADALLVITSKPPPKHSL